MAKVFADDIVLNYNGSDPYLALINNTIYDTGGNNNGRLDPGETVDLTATLRNIGGADFTDLSTIIISSDPYITISDNAGYFGSLVIDETKENTNDPYIISASASTPQGYNAQFQLIATDGGFVDTFDFSIIVGRINYFVWNPDPTPESGEAIHNILSSLGYTGNYDIILPTNGELANYSAVFVCVGIYANNYIIGSSSPEASALVDYLQNQGGRMYLEGGDVWYYDPLYQGGYDFGPLFGINATADGSSDMGPVVGQSGTFTNQMNFSYGGENSWMDHISPTGSGFLIFVDGDNSYDCGVANDAGTYQTVGTSFELGGLVDAGGVSTRAALLDSIMHFFGINLVVVEEANNSKADSPDLIISPNPAYGRVRFSVGAFNSGPVEILIYDVSGRLVKSFKNVTEEYVIWDQRDDADNQIPAGIYFVRIQTRNFHKTRKLVLIK